MRQVNLQRIIHHPIQPGGQAHAAGVVVAGGLAGCPHFPFGVVADEGGGRGIDGGFDSIAVTVINKGGDSKVIHHDFNQGFLSVKGLFESTKKPNCKSLSRNGAFRRQFTLLTLQTLCVY